MQCNYCHSSAVIAASNKMKGESPAEHENLSLSSSIKLTITPFDFEGRRRKNTTIDLNIGGLMWVKETEKISQGKHQLAEVDQS